MYSVGSSPYRNSPKGGGSSSSKRQKEIPEGPISDFWSIIEHVPPEEWQKRTGALQALVKMIPKGSDYVQQEAWYNSPKILRHLTVPLAELLRDPRSSVVKRTCEAMTALLSKCQEDARYLFKDLMPTILGVHAQTVQIIRNYVQTMVTDSLPVVPCKMVMPIWMERLKSEKSRTVREACALYLSLALHHWSESEEPGYLTNEIWLQVGASLMRVLRDPSPTVRLQAKSGLEIMKSIQPVLWDQLVRDPDGPAGKDPKLQRALLQPDGGGAGDAIEDLSVVSRSSMANRSIKSNSGSAFLAGRQSPIPSSLQINTTSAFHQQHRTGMMMMRNSPRVPRVPTSISVAAAAPTTVTTTAVTTNTTTSSRTSRNLETYFAATGISGSSNNNNSSGMLLGPPMRNASIAKQQSAALGYPVPPAPRDPPPSSPSMRASAVLLSLPPPSVTTVASGASSMSPLRNNGFSFEEGEEEDGDDEVLVEEEDDDELLHHIQHQHQPRPKPEQRQPSQPQKQQRQEEDDILSMIEFSDTPFIANLNELKTHAKNRRSRRSSRMLERWQQTLSPFASHDDDNGSSGADEHSPHPPKQLQDRGVEHGSLATNPTESNTTGITSVSPFLPQSLHDDHLDHPAKPEAPSTTMMDPTTPMAEHIIIANQLLEVHQKHIDFVMDTLRMEMDTVREFEHVLLEHSKTNRPSPDEVVNYFESVELCLEQRKAAAQVLLLEMDRICKGSS